MPKKKICIIGLGYVGLPLAIAFAAKYKVIAFDIDLSRIEELDRGIDKTNEVDPLCWPCHLGMDPAVRKFTFEMKQ